MLFEGFDGDVDWFETTTTTTSSNHGLSPDAFDGFVDDTYPDLADTFMQYDPILDWARTVDWQNVFGPSTHESLDDSVYSDSSTLTSSEDSSHPPTPRDVPFDSFGDGQCAVVSYSCAFDFAFECPPVMSPSTLPDSIELFTTPLDATYGQPQQQFLLGAVAGAVCADVRLEADTSSPLTSQAPTPDAACGEASSALDATNNSKRRAGDDMDGTQKAAKRPRKQSTEKTLKCPHCDTRALDRSSSLPQVLLTRTHPRPGMARKNNLAKHIQSVHERIKAHGCPHPGCGRSFSRKHDALRHFQSEHTALGSPRKKPAAKK
ncbi:hypothetical protein NUW54_g13416 [Trametes sanguinea]|uniref:Uncharacterized protein n=1 Tax=Trametes sanguinea TaxID=158606 RepID=A0ACC1MM89_9APHY|nr:hypothetical protein NUW54_g13416 [Trametes sanguinea]